MLTVAHLLLWTSFETKVIMTRSLWATPSLQLQDHTVRLLYVNSICHSTFMSISMSMFLEIMVLVFFDEFTDEEAAFTV